MPDVSERYNVSALLDANLAAGRGDKVAIICGVERLTYAGPHASACALGRALSAFGVRREERVLLILDDTPVFAIAFWGSVRLGAVPVPLNPLLKVDDYRFFIEDTYARVVIVDPVYLAKLNQALEGLPNPPAVIVTGEEAFAGHRLPGLLNEHRGNLPPGRYAP